jgi:hypothetical protein
MRKAIFILFAATIFFTAKAQIITEAVYPGGSMFLTPQFLHPVQLTGGGDKYCEFYPSQSQIILYNLNHTIYHTINLPTLPPSAASIRVSYVSDALFDQNTADIEYVLQYTSFASANYNRVAIYRENGTLLFQRDSVAIEPCYWSEVPDRVFNTTAGAKMILSAQSGGNAIVLGLPGHLPCKECAGTGPMMIQSHENGSSAGTPYPNPAADFTTIPYALPEGERAGWLVLFDVAGKEVKRLQITNTFTSVTLSTQDIAAGTYSYRIESGQTSLPGEKLIIIH